MYNWFRLSQFGATRVCARARVNDTWIRIVCICGGPQWPCVVRRVCFEDRHESYLFRIFFFFFFQNKSIVYRRLELEFGGDFGQSISSYLLLLAYGGYIIVLKTFFVRWKMNLTFSFDARYTNPRCAARFIIVIIICSLLYHYALLNDIILIAVDARRVFIIFTWPTWNWLVVKIRNDSPLLLIVFAVILESPYTEVYTIHLMDAQQSGMRLTD